MIDLDEEIPVDEILKKTKSKFDNFAGWISESIAKMAKQQKKEKLYFIKPLLAAALIVALLLNLGLIFDAMSMVVQILLLIAVITLPIICIVLGIRYAIRKNKEKKANRAKEIQKYNACTYFQYSQLPLDLLEVDKDRYAEYLIYKALQPLEKQGAKFLFDVDIPRATGGSSKIDILMVSHKGIFVIQSRNLQGSIFGRENEKEWCQTVRGKKEFFANPVLHNKSCANHIKHLFNSKIPVHPIIVFPDKAKLDDVCVNYDNHVVNLNVVISIVHSEETHTAEYLTQEQIDAIHEALSV